MEKIIKHAIDSHQEALFSLTKHSATIEEIASLFILCLKAHGKIIFCGNGGSAADSQHLAAELVGRFQKDRRSLPAIALSTNTSILTAIGNDYGFEEVFSRQIEALAAPQDILVGISTSGQSKNVVRAVLKAKELGIKTIALSGGSGGALRELADVSIVIETSETPRIQEMHVLVGHIICKIVEEGFFG
jgi:D-sedoheptulose 7-phosphate isomerase